MIKLAVQHKGLAIVECLQPCPPYNDITTKDWYAGEDRKDAEGKPQSRLYKLDQTGFDPVVKNWSEDFQKRMAALQKAQEWGDHIPLGVFYKNELEPTLQERLSQRIPFYAENPPAKQKLCDGKRLQPCGPQRVLRRPKNQLELKVFFSRWGGCLLRLIRGKLQVPLLQRFFLHLKGKVCRCFLRVAPV